jgi:hypothetical protein
MAKKVAIRATLQLFMDADTNKAIDDAYAIGTSVDDLAKTYNCSHNTMMVIIGMIGYPVENWCKSRIEKQLENVQEILNSRVKIR